MSLKKSIHVSEKVQKGASGARISAIKSGFTLGHRRGGHFYGHSVIEDRGCTFRPVVDKRVRIRAYRVHKPGNPGRPYRILFFLTF